ncbi:hypothetical protein ACA910_018493 [Epithemia clementina (nom. ined.)]
MWVNTNLLLFFLLIIRSSQLDTSTTESVDETAAVGSPPQAPAAAASKFSSCPLDCKNGAACGRKKEIRTLDYVSSDQTIDGEWECDCGEDFTGSFCDVRRRKLESTTTTCGNLECQNNGECAPGQSYESPNALCDCSTAIEVVGQPPNLGLARYVGKYCEIEVKGNDFCSSDINLFCVNGGQCRLRSSDFVDQPCECPDDYTGRHCEYKSEHVQAECSLTCSNAGRCQHGMNPNDDSGANEALDLDDGATNNFMHCVCDEGHAGTNCEYEYIKCGGENRYCYHGSSCVPDGTNNENVCECTNESGVKLAGDFCEYKATDHCESPTPIDEVSALQLFDSTNKMDSAEIPFCVNNGVCYKVAGADDYYCSCDTRSWVGKRCEVKTVGQSQGYSPQPTDSGTGFEAKAPTPLHYTPSPSPSPSPSPAPTKAKSDAVASSFEADNEGMSAGGKFGIVLVVFGGIAFITVMAIYFHQRAYFIERVVYQEKQSHYPPPSDSYSNYPPPPDRQPHYPPPERQSHYPPPERSEMEMTPTNYGYNDGAERPNSLHRLNGMINGGRQRHSYTPAPSNEERDFANVELV